MDNVIENSTIGNGNEECLPDLFRLSTISVNFKVNFRQKWIYKGKKLL
jgi:hypothetical protein